MKLNMVGPATEMTGYGVHFVNLAKALGNHAEVNITPRSQIDPALSKDLLFMRMVERRFDYDAPTLNIWFADALHLFTGSPRIGFPVFETDLLNEVEIDHISNTPHILLPSKWAEGVVCNSFYYYGAEQLLSDTQFHVVGEGFNPAIFKPREVAENHMTVGWHRPYIQNIGKWEARKGHPELIEAMGKIADQGYSCTLVGMWGNLFQPDWQVHAGHHLTQHGFRQTSAGVYDKNKVKVVLAARVETHMDIANIISMCDFGVYPHKGEGWGLPILETMGSGKPVVATNYSGPSEYLNDASGILIEPSGKAPIYDSVFFPQGRTGNWATINVDELAAAIISMIEMNEPTRRTLGMTAFERASQFTWDESAKKVITMLESL